ncbi:MAG: NAD(P)H-dependent oxidoreductase [Chthoniobacterales bacterium]|nr:NAD(P)H-dependent oxidoreductase [Chthoniobacterales bacterium]
MRNYLVVSTSGNPGSRSRKMGRSACEALARQKIACEWLDLSEHDLPLCDANQCYEHPATQKVNSAIEKADGIIVAAPVYNFDVSASAKNMIELTGSSWEDKVVAFLCAAGGMSSYMSVMAYANSLMLDFRCVIIPRFVYATGSAFADGELKDAKIIERIEQVSSELVRFTEALRG